MTDEEVFLKEGAEYFGNRLIFKNKDVGVTAPGAALVLTAEGEEVVKRLRNIEDVEPKAVKTRKGKADTSDAPPPEDFL